MDENRDLGAENRTSTQGDDFEYDEAHDAPAGPVRGTSAPRPVNPPPEVNIGEDGDYGYDEAHDFGRR